MGELQAVVFCSCWAKRCFSSLLLWTFCKVVSLPLTPELERHKYDLWYKTYSLGIDFSSNLNFALITSEEKRKCHSTVWFPFVILHEGKNYEMKFSVNTAHAFKKHLIKSRPVFKWCDQAEACWESSQSKCFHTIKEYYHELLVGFLERKLNKSFILAFKSLSRFCLMSRAPLNVNLLAMFNVLFP